MAIEEIPWRPDWAVPPGDILAEMLEEREMSQSELARRMGRPTKTINEIVNGKAALTPDTAIQLELALGVSATVWNNLESSYREHIARQRATKELNANADWARSFPVKQLVAHKLIHPAETPGQVVASLLRYFGVSSPAAWEAQWQDRAVAFRKSLVHASSTQATAAWLRWGEIQALDIAVPPYDSKKLRTAAAQLKAVTRLGDFSQAVARAEELLAIAGVVLVLTPELPGAPISGAVQWPKTDKAIVQVSMRYKTTDQFWFTVLHEIRHLLARSRRDYIDEEGADTADEEEQQANEFARDSLISPRAYSHFISERALDQTAIRNFAKAEGVAVGIVVGRLQHDDYLPRNRFNGLKTTITWATGS